MQSDIQSDMQSGDQLKKDVQLITEAFRSARCCPDSIPDLDQRTVNVVMQELDSHITRIAQQHASLTLSRTPEELLAATEPNTLARAIFTECKDEFEKLKQGPECSGMDSREWTTRLRQAEMGLIVGNWVLRKSIC